MGVLIPVYENELPAFDVRETGYDRLLIEDHNRIQRVDELLDDEDVDDYYKNTFLEEANEKSNNTPAASTANVWVYVPQTSNPPTKEYPIIQSYVDICMRGCLSISSKFLHEFLKTTYGWHPQEIIDLMTTMNEKGKQQQESDNTSSSTSSTEEVVLGSWSNDRHSPIYPRADEIYSLENAVHLDQFLQQAALPVDSVRA